MGWDTFWSISSQTHLVTQVLSQKWSLVILTGKHFEGIVRKEDGLAPGVTADDDNDDGGGLDPKASKELTDSRALACELGERVLQ
jgi:hypothetical protein